MSFDISDYTRALQREVGAGRANGYTSQQALKSLIEGLDSGLRVDHDLRRAEVGGPDLIVYRGGLLVGCILLTGIGTDLNALEATAHRLGSICPNVLMTNYLDLRAGGSAQNGRLGVLRNGQVENDRGAANALNLLRQFVTSTPATVRTSAELADRLGQMAALLRDLLVDCAASESPDRTFLGHLAAWRAAFDPEISAEAFAADYVQAVVFGLVAAAMRHNSSTRQQRFTLRDAVWDQPPTSPFMRGFFREIENLDSRVRWLVEGMAALLAHTDWDALRTESSQRARHDDPLTRLYGVFRRVYAGETIPAQPEVRAVYLVNSVHHLLHRRFKRALGLADEDVVIINPAAGSGTLLFFVIQQVFDTIWQQQQLGAWNGYVSDDFLPRLVGYECSLANYALAHLKASMKLNTTGYRFASSQRLNLFLRAGEEPPGMPDDSFANLLRDEIHAAPAPRLPVTVVLNVQPVSDAQAQIEAARAAVVTPAGGLVALRLPGGWLDDPETCTLRARVLRDYSDLYLLKLGDDSLCVLVRRPDWSGEKGARVHFAAWEGTPEAAVTWLADRALASIDWQVIHPHAPDYPFVLLAASGDQPVLYRQGWLLTDVMPLSAVGLPAEPVPTADETTVPLLVRPFDVRASATQPASDPLRHMLRGDNLGLCVQGSHVLCTQYLIHEHLLGEATHLHPLYVYPGTARLVSDSPFAPGERGRRPNLNVQLILRLAEHLGLTFVPDGRGDLKETFGPEDVFYYVYAVLSSPAYRERYAALLDQAELRVPFPDSAKQFRGLSHAGRDLARLHLLLRADNWPLLTGYSGAGADRVEAGYPRFIELAGEPGGRIYIHKEKYFSGVERALWMMRLSGVPVLQTWLAERVGQVLTWRDLHHYQSIIVALARSVDVLHEIDELLD